MLCNSKLASASLMEYLATTLSTIVLPYEKVSYQIPKSLEILFIYYKGHCGVKEFLQRDLPVFLVLLLLMLFMNSK